MNATVKSENGHSWIECEYNPATCDWNSVIAAALASVGVRPGQMRVICRPARATVSHNNNQMTLP